MRFDLKRPCKNCPFIKGTTMVLSPGRMEGIVEETKNDLSVFPCHKTTKGKTDDETGDYIPDHTEQACMGALAYGLKHNHKVPVLARLAMRDGTLDYPRIEINFTQLEEPGKWPTHPTRPTRPRRKT